MDFQEAQARFQWLEGQFRAGGMDPQQYQAALNDLRVTDGWGQVWMIQAHSGAWHVYQNGAWVAAQPPVPLYPAYPTPPAPAPAAESSLFFRYFRGFLIWLAIWVLIAGGFWLFYGSSHQDEAGEIFLGIGAAAALSLVLMLWSFRGGWKGQVVEMRVVREESLDDDGGVEYEDVRYAFIRQTDGKMRRERALPIWNQGDWLEKKRGENWVRKL